MFCLQDLNCHSNLLQLVVGREIVVHFSLEAGFRKGNYYGFSCAFFDSIVVVGFDGYIRN